MHERINTTILRRMTMHITRFFPPVEVWVKFESILKPHYRPVNEVAPFPSQKWITIPHKRKGIQLKTYPKSI